MKTRSLDELKKDLSVVWHFIKLIQRISPSYILVAVVSAALGSIAPFLNILMPRAIINELMAEQRMNQLMLFVAVLIIGNACISLLHSLLSAKLKKSEERLINDFELHVGKHIMSMDFENLEDAAILDLKEKALFNIKLHNALRRTPEILIGVGQILFTLIGVVSIIFILSPLLVVLIIALNAFNAMIYNRVQSTKFQFYKDIAVFNRQFQYHKSLSQDFANAKDIRIFNMADYIIGRMNLYQDKANTVFFKMFLKQRRHDGLSAINVQMQTLAAYAYVTWRVFTGSITIGDFTMYITTVNHFSSILSQLMIHVIELRQLSKILQSYLDFEALPNRYLNGSKSIADIKDIKIEFENVWFKYPGAETYTLKDVSILINKGEKLSVVGKNGAGKTTFIKLLCGLYIPDKGRIMVNGIDINDYDSKEYNKLFAVVFQDYKIFSFSVKENVVLGEDRANRENVIAALDKVGVYNKVKDLPLNLDTLLYKNFDANGVELSGGEMQKIAIARALYKNAPIVILDEPTAALDPLAEHELYLRLNEMAAGKTTVYISHRLSSCCFCDKIAVFDEGKVIEYGSHLDLVSRNGLYTEMWKAQAQYYQ